MTKKLSVGRYGQLSGLVEPLAGVLGAALGKSRHH